MAMHRPITRRAALKDMGKAGLAVMVFGTACTSEGEEQPTTPAPGATSTTPSSSAGTNWARVEMAIVSAYFLYRGGEATLVDTGQPGSVPDIEATLSEIGLGWEAVTNVILTHKHPDHQGSISEVSALASNAPVHVGAGDAGEINELAAGTPQVASDGDIIFDLEVIETPGHTPGHISVLDPAAGILVAGDAMNRVGGTLNNSDPSFTEDLALADTSVKKLAGFDYEIILFGHGDPILTGGSAEVNDLAAGIPG